MPIFFLLNLLSLTYFTPNFSVYRTSAVLFCDTRGGIFKSCMFKPYKDVLCNKMDYRKKKKYKKIPIIYSKKTIHTNDKN